MHAVSVPDWAYERGRMMARFPAFDPRRAALIVVDMQRGFVAPDAPLGNAHAHDILGNVNRLVLAMREAGARICWSRQTTVDEGPGRMPEWQLFDGSLPSLTHAALKAGAPDHAIYEDLAVAPGDLVFDKYRYSCFVNAGIDLDAWLKAEGIEDVVIVGTITNCCCESTARDAAMRDYRVYFISDATAAVTDEEHNAALLSAAAILGQLVDTDAMLALIPAPARIPA